MFIYLEKVPDKIQNEKNAFRAWNEVKIKRL